MSIQITWSPNPESDIASYIVQSAPATTGPWTTAGTVAGTVYAFTDPGGTASTYYRLIAVDTLSNQSTPSAPFLPVQSAPAITNTVCIDQNYGGSGALRYMTAGACPIEAAVIRVFRKSDCDQGRTQVALATTMTDCYGDWVSPIWLTAGLSYVLVVAKEGMYGPDRIEITL